jgi:hypothetical protein
MVVCGPTAVQAIMGEDPRNRGLVLADEKDVVLLACVLGGACRQADGTFYRSMFANEIVGQGIIEEGIEIPGLGIGSIMSTEVVPVEDDSFLTDTFCWTGASVRQCLRILDDDGGTSFGGTVIDTYADGGQPDGVETCAGAAALFGQPSGFFDYLVEFDEDLFGDGGAVKVVTCDGVAATSLSNADIAQEGVIVKAHQGLAAYDLKLYGGRYCC